MSKFNTGKASVLALTAVLAVAAFLLGKSITSVNACTTAPVNCVGGWDYTDVCSKSCGGGLSQQVFNISIPASNGGTACTNNQGDLIWSDPSCNTKACEVQCPDNASPNSNNVCECNSGYHEVNSDGQTVEEDHIANFTCVADPTPVPTPLNCTGDQHPDAAGLNCVSFSQAGPPPQGPYTPPQGQVLGASTMAGTGSFAENLYIAIMGLGGIITALGVKNFKKGYKVA
jgi:hypothetical protein